MVLYLTLLLGSLRAENLLPSRNPGFVVVMATRRTDLGYNRDQFQNREPPANVRLAEGKKS